MSDERKNGALIVKRLRDLHLVSCMADMKDSNNETLPGIAADYIEHLESLSKPPIHFSLEEIKEMHAEWSNRTWQSTGSFDAFNEGFTKALALERMA